MKNKKEKILFFTNELAIMLKSGLTFTTAIEITLKEEKDKNFKEVLKKIHKNLIAGKSIFESFKNFDKIFGNTYLYMLKIGEVSGSITERLEDISKSLEFDLANQKKIRRNISLSNSCYKFNSYNSNFFIDFHTSKFHYNF